MSLIAAADALMGILKLHRAECRHCVYSLGTDRQDMYCAHHAKLVNADSQCEQYMREGGSDD